MPKQKKAAPADELILTYDKFLLKVADRVIDLAARNSPQNSEQVRGELLQLSQFLIDTVEED